MYIHVLQARFFLHPFNFFFVSKVTLKKCAIHSSVYINSQNQALHESSLVLLILKNTN